MIRVKLYSLVDTSHLNAPVKKLTMVKKVREIPGMGSVLSGDPSSI